MSTAAEPRPEFAMKRRRARLLGMTSDEFIKAFFGGNALVSAIVLTLITIFLLREGMGFFGQNRENLRIYRLAGLEYVDLIREQESGHTALTRYLSDVRTRQFTWLVEERKNSIAQANEALADFDAFSGEFSDAAEPIRGIVSDLGEAASAIKTKFIVTQDQWEERAQLIEAGRADAAEQVKIEEIDFPQEVQALTGTLPYYQETSAEFARVLTELMQRRPALPAPELQARMERFGELTAEYVKTFPEVERKLATWDPTKPVPLWESVTAFVFGRQWLTASFWQDWYGVVPLFVGSLLVAAVALALAVPFGVGAAIYVNQIASPREQRFIKPCIEFISAIPSVVLGFFGIAVLGETLRALSNEAWLSWIPGFPYPERLNVLTAGCLLALLSVPTIFTLAEDALNNVPLAFKEASYALGATRLQTIARIIVPAGLSGIISAVLLGFGRVIGETMVVLLCAGNRIAIPDFSDGLAVMTQPVHTMTGIIAQEMGEVVRGSIHYRALFVVGIVLFFLSLLINYAAQHIVRRYRISIG